MELAAHFPKVLSVLAEIGEQSVSVDSEGHQGLIAIDHIDDALERGDRVDVEATDDGGFLGVLFGEQQPLYPVGASGDGDWQGAFDWPDSAVKRQFADDERIAALLRLGISVCAQDSERDRQIKARAFFLYVGGRQVDGDSMEGEEEAAVVDGSANAFAALAHRRVRQADHGEGGLHAVGRAGRKIYLDFDVVSVDSEYGSAEHFEQHQQPPCTG